MDKKTILASFKADLRASETLRKEQDARIEKWKSEILGKPYGNEVNGRSKIVARTILKQLAWQHSSLLDPFVSTNDIVKVSPVTFEDVEAARQSEVLLNYQFCRQFPRYNFLNKALKVLAQEGTVVIQTGWDYEDEEVEAEVEVAFYDEEGNVQVKTETVTEVVVKKNQPTAVVCRNKDIFIDPTCKDDMSSCQFVIHRFETDLSTLRQDKRYKNLDKVSKELAAAHDDVDYDSEDDTEFRFEDDPRKKILVYEYWGNYDVNNDGIAEPIVCAWVGDTIIRMQSNPYPDKKPPFLVVPFNSTPFQLYGESDAELLSDSQRVTTAMLRGIMDNMAMSNNGQLGIRKGALDPLNKKRFLDGDNFEYNTTPNDFWTGSFNQIPGSAFDVLNLMQNEAESLTATKSFSQGISGGSLGSTATGVRGALDATAVRRLDRVRNISENLIKPLMRKWLSYNHLFLDDSEIVRVTNEDYVEIRRDDLAGKIDLDIYISTAEDNAAKAQEMAFLLQTMGQTMEPEMRNIIMAEIARLNKMPDLEKQLREWKPEPDPMVEQMKQLELQRAILELDLVQQQISEKSSRARNTDVDSQLKSARILLEESKSRLANEEADLKALEFLERDSGQDVQKKIAIKEQDRLAKLDLMAFQALNNDSSKSVSIPRA